MGSASSESENLGHLAASLDTSVMFAGFNTLTFHDSGKSAIWALTYKSGVLKDWRNEVDIHLHVSNVLHDAISAAGLEDTLSYFNELSIFRLREDIWIVLTTTGNPVGVLQVYKPDTLIMDSPFVHGQIFDCILL
jgi:hypothetical protein